MTSDLVISTADLDTARQLGAWALREGWMPGDGDVDAFRAADPEGFLVGHLADRLVAGISAVHYDRDFTFVGFYITEPDLRGQGIGHLMMDAALLRVGQRTSALDGVEDQVPTYELLGYEFAHWTPRYTAPAAQVRDALSEASGVEIVPFDTTSPLYAEALAYDTAHVPASRSRFVAEWLRADSPRQSFAAVRDERLIGYATARPALPQGSKVGPLFANDEEAARALLRRCAEVAAESEGDLALDVPTPNSAGTTLAEECGMTPGFRCARMYRGPRLDLPLNEIWGSTTFELG